jgi:hypothetical protein
MKIATTIAGLALLATTSAQAADIGVGVKAGTLGAGVDLSIALTQTINARLALTSVSADFDETLDIEDNTNRATVDANLDLDFGATALLFDWYIFDGTFHVTGGMMKNNSSIDLLGTITSPTVEFDGQTYNVSDFVSPTMSGKVRMGNSYQPYLGVGWGRKADDNPGFSFSVELGVLLMDPSVDLNAPTVTAASGLNQADIDQDVQAAESSANDELSALETWPVISLGLNYAF